MSLLSTTTLKVDYLTGLSASDSVTEATLGREVTRAEAVAARELGYPGTVPTLASGSYVLRLAASRLSTDRLALPVAPVTAIASVYQDTDQVFGASTEVVSTDYERVDYPTGSLLILLPSSVASSWYTGEREIKATVTAGYANEAAIPADLADAIYLLAASRWTRRNTREILNKSADSQSESFRDFAAIPKEVADIFARYALMGTVGAS